MHYSFGKILSEQGVSRSKKALFIQDFTKGITHGKVQLTFVTERAKTRLKSKKKVLSYRPKRSATLKSIFFRFFHFCIL